MAGNPNLLDLKFPTFFLFFLPLLHLIPFSHSLLHPIDFLALQSLHKSLSDTPGGPRFLQLWDFTTDPCTTFPGILCSSDRIVSLNLGDPRAGSPGLSGQIHPAIGNLSSLTELTVVPGHITGVLPTTLSRLTNLRFLAVPRNRLSGPIPPNLSRLTSLRTLDLSYNLLTGPIPPQIGTLPVLTNLILSHNRLTGPVPRFTSPPSSPLLTRVDLSRNRLTGRLSRNAFPPSSSLEYLSLSQNQLTGPISLFLTGMTRLRYLDLSWNRFDGMIPSDLLTFPSLKTVLLQHNFLYGPIRPRRAVTIGTLDVSHNRLSGTVPRFLSTVRSLRLDHNRFSGRVPAEFAERVRDRSVRRLYLQCNYLTGVVGMDLTTAAAAVVDGERGSEVCLEFNCMVPPVGGSSCPLEGGMSRTRPAKQCTGWRG